MKNVRNTAELHANTNKNRYACDWAILAGVGEAQNGFPYLSQGAGRSVSQWFKESIVPAMARLNDSTLVKLAGLLIAQQTDQELETLQTIDPNWRGVRKDSAFIAQAVLAGDLPLQSLAELVEKHPAQSLYLGGLWGKMVRAALAQGIIKPRALKAPKNYGVKKS